MTVYIWLALLVIFLIAEAATPQLVSIWFALGSLGGLLLAAFGAHVWVQVIVAVLLVLISLVATRPFVKKFTETKKTNTNADRVIGKTAMVTEEINEFTGSGRVTIMGANWAAVTEDGSTLSTGEEAVVERIEGVKLIVRPSAAQSAGRQDS